jgi:hypothetical protein
VPSLAKRAGTCAAPPCTPAHAIRFGRTACKKVRKGLLRTGRFPAEWLSLRPTPISAELDQAKIGSVLCRKPFHIEVISAKLTRSRCGTYRGAPRKIWRFQHQFDRFLKNYVSRTVGVLGGGRPDRPLFLPVVGL